MWYKRRTQNFIPNTCNCLHPFREISKKIESLHRATSSNVLAAKNLNRDEPFVEPFKPWTS